MKNIFRKIWPVRKRYYSTVSGALEINWLNGKKVLDSKNANYSYGSLQRVLKFGLNHCIFDRSAHILLLGMGGGSVIETLRKDFLHAGKITAVETDAVMIDLAEKEFGVSPDNGLDIVHNDAFLFIEKDSGMYDLIIIDIFIDNRVPANVFSETFWSGLIKRLNLHGNVLFNAGLLSENHLSVQPLINKLKHCIQFKKAAGVEGANLVLVGTRTE